MPTIRELREQRGLTQVELAAMVGVSAVSIYKWETGQWAPRSLHLKQLAQVFGISMDDVDLLTARVPMRRGRPRRPAPPAGPDD